MVHSLGEERELGRKCVPYVDLDLFILHIRTKAFSSKGGKETVQGCCIANKQGLQGFNTHLRALHMEVTRELGVYLDYVIFDNILFFLNSQFKKMFWLSKTT